MPVTLTTARGTEPVDVPTIGINDEPGEPLTRLALGDTVFIGQRTCAVRALLHQSDGAVSVLGWHDHFTLPPGDLIDEGRAFGVVQLWRYRAAS